MTRVEIRNMMKYFQAAYTNFYADRSITKEVVDIWEASFGREDPYIVKKAAVNYVASHEYAPTIAGLKKQIDMIKNPEADADLWGLVYKAISNGIYGAEEEFAKLPQECRSFLGSASALRDLAQCDPLTIGTVVKGQFLKQVDAIRQRQTVQNGLPAEVKQAIMESKMQMLTEGESA